MTAAAGHADQERGSTGTVTELSLVVGQFGIIGHPACKAVPGAQRAAVDLAPGVGVETWLNLRRPMAPVEVPKARWHGILAHTDALVRMISGIGGSTKSQAGVTVAFAADELQQFIVAVTPVETKGLVEARAGQPVEPVCSSNGVVDQPQVLKRWSRLSLRSTRHQSIRTPMRLLENVGVEPIIAGSRLVPDLASRRSCGSVRQRRHETRVIVGDWHPVGGGMLSNRAAELL